MSDGPGCEVPRRATTPVAARPASRVLYRYEGSLGRSPIVVRADGALECAVAKSSSAIVRAAYQFVSRSFTKPDAHGAAFFAPRFMTTTKHDGRAEPAESVDGPVTQTLRSGSSPVT